MGLHFKLLPRVKDAAVTWTPSFLLLPVLSQVEMKFCKGQAKPKGCYLNRPAGRIRRGPGKSCHCGKKSLFSSDTMHRRSSLTFVIFDGKQIRSRSPKAFPFPAASLSFRWAFPLMVGKSIPLSKFSGILFSQAW